MRSSRQVTWLCLLGGVLYAGTALAAPAGLRSSRRHPVPASGYQNATFSTPSILADPLDDDDAPSRVRLAPITPSSVLEASWPEPAVARAPVTTCNRPAARHRKVPAPSGDDVPPA
jgi:hypothetical protein